MVQCPPSLAFCCAAWPPGLGVGARVKASHEGRQAVGTNTWALTGAARTVSPLLS